MKEKIKKFLRILPGWFFSGAGQRVAMNIRLILVLRKRSMFLAKVVANRLQRKYGVFLSPKAEFDYTLELRHPVGIVVGEGVKIGKNVVIYQGVTLGGARIGDGALGRYPEIGDNSVIFSGAAIIGAVKVGRNCIIGANSVVTRDIPDGSTAVGAPARLIKRKL